MSPETVALYARVSSDRQATAGTIASQLATLRERIAADGATLVPAHEFVDDGYSGSTLTRPALERLRDRVALGSLTRLYVLAPDRLARRYTHQALLLEEFARAGVRVCFLHHPPDQTPDDVLLTQIQGILAEYERAAIEERTRRGRRFAAQQGRVSVLSGAPYADRSQRPTPAGLATYTVVPSEAPVIEQIFTWVGLERCSLAEVARRLNATGTPTRSGKPWSRATLNGILSNPAYRGQAAFGKTRSLAGPPEGRPSRSRRPTSRRTWRHPRRAASRVGQHPRPGPGCPRSLGGGAGAVAGKCRAGAPRTAGGAELAAGVGGLWALRVCLRGQVDHPPERRARGAGVLSLCRAGSGALGGRAALCHASGAHRGAGRRRLGGGQWAVARPGAVVDGIYRAGGGL